MKLFSLGSVAFLFCLLFQSIGQAETVRYVQCSNLQGLAVVAEESRVMNSWSGCRYLSAKETRRWIKIIEARRLRYSQDALTNLSNTFNSMSPAEKRRLLKKIQSDWERDCAPNPSKCPLGFSSNG